MALRDAGETLDRGIAAISGKWKARIIIALHSKELLRYGEIRDLLGGISDAVLSSALRDLCEDGIVERRQYASMPPKVEYSLSAKGDGAYLIIKAIAAWADSAEWDKPEGPSGLSSCDLHSPV